MSGSSTATGGWLRTCSAMTMATWSSRSTSPTEPRLGRSEVEAAVRWSRCSGELPVAARGVAAMAGERPVEGVLGAVTDLSRDHFDGVAGVLQPGRCQVHAPAGEVCQRRLPDRLGEPACQRRAGHMYLAR